VATTPTCASVSAFGVSANAQQATIAQTYTWSYGPPTLGDPKSYAGLRTLALNSVALRALELLQALRANEYVVATETGRVPNPSNLRETLDKLCRQAAVPRLTLHQLRHQCASLLIALGADVKQVQHYLGHSTASVTLNIYAHLLQRGDTELAKRLNQVLDPDPSTSSPGSSSNTSTDTASAAPDPPASQ